MRDCVASRLRLPDISGIRIQGISDKDTDLISFLNDCTPASLNLLAVNYFPNISTGIKSKFYVDAFSKAAARTNKEVYFSRIEFSAEDLQTVVRAAHKAERIVFHFCCIHCSSGLDFGADLNYNTKFLSFQQWGNMSKERMTDWKSDPSSFSFVVDAIDRCRLRVSLQKLSIAFNETLSTFKVQEELKAKGMPHISVVEDSPAPLSL